MSAKKCKEPKGCLREYEFAGRHLIASYSACDEGALKDIPALCAAMEEGVVAAGATILNTIRHPFTNGGFTMLVLLSESHASIHTYPEHGACFVDIFTCGETCVVEKFDEVLRAYLKPGKVASRIVRRDESCSIRRPARSAGSI